MKEKETCHYTESIIYEMEQTVVYSRVKGSQFFNQLNIGITIDQFTMLDAIYCNDDVCQRDLSKIVLKDRSNTGRILNILEEKKFIEKKIETKGKRLVKKIYITEKGKQLIEEYQPRLKKAFEQVLTDISDEEISTLRNIVMKLKESLSKITNIQI